MTEKNAGPGHRTNRLAHIDPFVTHIEKICHKEPGLRAGLRRGVGHHPDTAFRSHAVVAGWVRPDVAVTERVSEAREWAYYAVAAMIAAQPGRARRDDDTDGDPTAGEAVAAEPEATGGGDRRRANLGVALAQAVARGSAGQRAIAHDSAEKRLHLLTRQGLPGLHRHLPATVRQLRSANVPVDWSVLIDDLSRWSGARDQVAKEWLQAFYQSVRPSTNDNTTPGSAES